MVFNRDFTNTIWWRVRAVAQTIYPNRNNGHLLFGNRDDFCPCRPTNQKSQAAEQVWLLLNCRFSW